MLDFSCRYIAFIKSILFTILFIFVCFIALNICSASEQNSGVIIGPTEITYTTVKNDTLSSIALQFTKKISHWQAIGKRNGIRNDRTIAIGTAIVIPAELLAEIPSTATVVAMAGTVTETKKDNSTIALAIGSQVLEGSHITTAKNSFITFALPDESRISIPSNSQVIMAKLRMSEYTQSPRTEVKLVQGRVESKITPLTQNKGRFEVTSPLSIAAVRGTHFRVGVGDGDGIANEVLTGAVAVGKLDKSNTLVLPAGKGNIINRQEVGKAIDLLAAPQLAQGFQLQERTTLQFTVIPQANALHYRAQISLDAAGQNVIAESMEKELRMQFNDIEDGQYFVKTTAIDGQGLEGIPAIYAFTMKARPEPPFPLQPKKKVRTQSVLFNWTQAAPAISYRLQIASDALFQHIVLDQADIKGVEFDVHDLALGHYFWRIATVTETKGQPDQGPFSVVEAFQVLAPQTMNAVNDTGGHELEFSWPSEPEQQFLVQIATDNAFKNIYLTKETKEARLAIPRPASGVYFIRVRATDADGFVGRFSATQGFEIFQRWTSSNGEALQSIGGVVRGIQY